MTKDQIRAELRRSAMTRYPIISVAGGPPWQAVLDAIDGCERTVEICERHLGIFFLIVAAALEDHDDLQ